MDKGPLSITITPGTVVTIFAIGLLAWLLYFLRDLILIVLTAVVLSSAIEPGVQWFMKKRLSRMGAVLSVYAIVLMVFFSIIYLLFPPLLEEIRGFAANLPQFVNALSGIEKLLSNGIAQSIFSSTSLSGILLQFQDLILPTGQGALSTLYSVFGGIFSFLLIIVLSVYFAFQETGVDDFLKIVVPVKHQEYAIDLWKRSHYKIGLWMQGQLILSLIIGVLGYLWLAIWQVPYAFLIAVFAAVIEIIPVFGSFISGVLAVIVAAIAGGPTLALIVAAGFLVINLLQSHLIYPLVVKQVVGVPPLMVILAMIAGGQIAGFLGVILAVPVAAALREFVNDIQKNRERELKALAK